MPLAIFVKRIKDLTQEMIILAERKISRVLHEEFVDHWLQHQIKSDERFPPVVGDEELFDKPAERLPVRICLPASFPIQTEVRERQLNLADAISQALDTASFIAGLPQWPAYDPGSRATMILNDECHVGNDPGKAERMALSSLRQS